jgi:hypothetical protein
LNQQSDSIASNPRIFKRGSDTITFIITFIGGDCMSAVFLWGDEGIQRFNLALKE